VHVFFSSNCRAFLVTTSPPKSNPLEFFLPFKFAVGFPFSTSMRLRNLILRDATLEGIVVDFSLSSKPTFFFRLPRHGFEIFSPSRPACFPDSENFPLKSIVLFLFAMPPRREWKRSSSPSPHPLVFLRCVCLLLISAAPSLSRRPQTFFCQFRTANRGPSLSKQGGVSPPPFSDMSLFVKAHRALFSSSEGTIPGLASRRDLYFFAQS